MIISDNPIKSYSSLHISHWPVGVLTAHTSFFIQLLSPRTKFDLQTKTFKMTPRTKRSHEFEMTECLGPPLWGQIRVRPNIGEMLGQRQFRPSPGHALNSHSGNDWGQIPLLSGVFAK